MTMDLQRTRGGIRLSQHGVVISEMRLRPGPTHSVFDILASLVALLSSPGRVGVLGFAGGGMMAPLRQAGFSGPVDAVDLDSTSYGLFARHCGDWAGEVNWHQGDAVEWLRAQERTFSILIEDLSVPRAGDVFKPRVSWEVLPELMSQRLVPGGVAILNQIPDEDGSWPQTWPGLSREMGPVFTLGLDDFENRIVVAGGNIGTARSLAARLRAALRRMGSRQAGRLQVRTGLG
jgi:hypothetical protein